MPEVLRQWDSVRLNKEGAGVRITEMARWQGMILRQIDKDYMRVAWNQRDILGNQRIWTERIDFLAKA